MKKKDIAKLRLREKQLVTISIEAKEKGMSYGQYVAFLEEEKLRKERMMKRASVSTM